MAMMASPIANANPGQGTKPIIRVILVANAANSAEHGADMGIDSATLSNVPVDVVYPGGIRKHRPDSLEQILS
jgi:hypothetical protein